MKDENEIKRLERRARSFMLSKEIPPPKMELVRSVMNNRVITPEEKYSAIIDLIKNCPDKKVDISEPEKREQTISPDPARSAARTPSNENETEGPFVPVENSYYIEDILKKYRHLKLFKKRYLVHRGNRFGFGIRKRLIPTRKLHRLLHMLADYHNIISGRISSILTDILKDESIEVPVVFNYLRLFRKWVMRVPLVKHEYESIRWMERHNFENEFRDYTISFFSFSLINPQVREQILLQVETLLRNQEDIVKEKLTGHENEQTRSLREKRNLAKEKTVYVYMVLLRSFLQAAPEEAGELTNSLKRDYRINSLSDCLLIIMEALVFQRPVTKEKLFSYYGIKAPVVSHDRWDYSEDLLRQYGKDQESIRKKKLAIYKRELTPYETMYIMMKFQDQGQNILMQSVSLQWKLIDRKKQEPSEVYKTNFFKFLDAMINYFNNAFSAFLNGSLFQFVDSARQEHEGSLFTHSYFEEELSLLDRLLDMILEFKTGNPTYSATRNELRRELNSQSGPDLLSGNILRQAGELFYSIASNLQFLYDSHRRWIYNGKKINNPGIIYQPVRSKSDISDGDISNPFPYYDCTVKGIKNPNPILKNFTNARLFNDSLTDGIIIRLIAFSYQAAFECYNDRIYADLDSRREILRKIDSV